MSYKCCGVASCGGGGGGVRFMHVCILQVRLWSLCNRVTGLTSGVAYLFPPSPTGDAEPVRLRRLSVGGRHLHNYRGILWSLATATNRAQAGSSSCSIQLPPPSALVTAKRGTKARVVGFKW